MPGQSYGNSQIPSSRPPEPPYRGQGTGQPRYDDYQASAQPDLRGVDVPGEIHATGSYVPLGPPEATENFQNARFGDTASMPQADYGSQPYDAAQNSRQQRRRRDAAQQPARKSGAGKTFLFGFLGALVACALALGGFAIWQGNNTQKLTSNAATLLGSSDQSVINAVDEGQTLAEAVAAKALPAVVAVYNYQTARQSSYGFGYGTSQDMGDSLTASGMGSGVVISEDGYILTNYHVVQDAEKLTVTVNGSERDAEYVGGDSSSDIAVIKVSDTEGLVAADIGDSDNLKVGEWVMTIGAPLGLEQSVATGVVSATNRSTIMDMNSTGDAYSMFYTNSTPSYTYYPNMIQTDAVINPGNSGGALVDADGKLIGINSIISSYSGNYAGVGFAIPVNYAVHIAQDIIDGKEPTHAALGVSISQVNSQTASRYNLSASSGAYIAEIYEGSGAASSELQVGDIITAVNGKSVSSTTDVTLSVREHNVGDTVTVTVNRNGETVDVPVVLGSDEAFSTDAGTRENQQAPYGEGQGSESGRGEEYDMDDLEYLMRILGL